MTAAAGNDVEFDADLVLAVMGGFDAQNRRITEQAHRIQVLEAQLAQRRDLIAAVGAAFEGVAQAIADLSAAS